MMLDLCDDRGEACIRLEAIRTWVLRAREGRCTPTEALDAIDGLSEAATSILGGPA